MFARLFLKCGVAALLLGCVITVEAAGTGYNMTYYNGVKTVTLPPETAAFKLALYSDIATACGRKGVKALISKCMGSSSSSKCRVAMGYSPVISMLFIRGRPEGPPAVCSIFAVLPAFTPKKSGT